MKKFWKFVIGFIIVAVIFRCGMSIGKSGNTQAKTEVPPQAYVHEAYTETPVPTKAPTQAYTETTAPTNVSTQVPTPTETSLKEYANAIYDPMQSISTNLTLQGTMFTAAGSDPSLIFSDNWKFKMYSLIDETYAGLTEIVAVKPPAGFEQLHSYLVNAREEYGLFRADLKDGIENYNSTSINNANVHMTSFTDYINLATGELPQ